MSDGQCEFCGASQAMRTDRAHEVWKRRCENITKLCESTAWSSEPDFVYQHIIDVVAEVLQCCQTHLHLMTVTGDRFVKLAYHADESHLIEWEDTLPATVGRMQWMMRTRSPIVMDYEHPNSEDRIPPEAYEHGLKSAVSIPLLAGDDLVGMCSVVYETTMEWSDDDLAYLQKIGRVLGTSIQRIQITKKAAELQMLDERKLLSSEIHDNVSQLIGSLSLSAATALASYDAGDDDGVRADLERFEMISGKVIRILRDEMLSLRIPLERTDGLIEGIKECLAHFEKNWGIPAQLRMKVIHGFPVVPLQTSLQLTRILNECLSNILKHADATKVTVTVEESVRCLSLIIEDNGRGFDLAAVPPERLGLKIMHERAAIAGGSLTILSSPEGTTVCIDIPKNRIDSAKGSLV